MKKGRSVEQTISAKAERIISVAGLVVPVLLLLYGLLLQARIIHNEHAFSSTGLYSICAAWFIVGAYQLVRPHRTKRDLIIRLVLYHLFAIGYIWLVSGFDMPFMSCWILLFYASYVYLGRNGLLLSIFALFIASFGDLLISVTNTEYVIRSNLFFLGTLLIGYVGSVLTSDQLADHKELSKSRAKETLQRDRVLTIVNNLADAVFSTDEDGIIQIYNAAALNLLDTNSELKGKSIDSVISLFTADNKKVRLLKEFNATKSVASREDVSATISGETIHIGITYSPIRGINSSESVGNDGYIVIMRDITKQKSLEEERDEFISVVSHELRTPITIAEGSLSNMQIMMERDDLPQSRLLESAKLSHEQVLFLAKMVNDLSTLSRAERGTADATEEINVSQLIHDLYNEYAPQAEAKGLRLNLDISPKLGKVVASRLYLKELLQNFVTNAIKYTKEGEVVIRAHKKDDAINFSVKDTGIGISKSDQAHIFDKFWRSEDYRTRETGGTGLGLYVARKLSRKLGTKIELTSRLNHGSTFSFELRES